ncbi:MAG: hypothetical protein M0R17_08450 [Candidatus Omnitrophica bacterium]|jgi:hypothetical protein|nr:hypothetical protein [Candidatus Omnitrophota bacterium]
MHILTVKERINWLKSNPTKYGIGVCSINEDWNEYISKTIEVDLYSYAFNHPFYCGRKDDNIITDDEMRHLILDDLEVPRIF